MAGLVQVSFTKNDGLVKKNDWFSAKKRLV